MADMNHVIDNVVVAAEAAVEPVKTGAWQKVKDVIKEWAPAAGLAAVSAAIGYVAGKNHVIGKAVNAVANASGKKEAVEVPAQQPVAATEATVDVSEEMPQ